MFSRSSWITVVNMVLATWLLGCSPARHHVADDEWLYGQREMYNQAAYVVGLRPLQKSTLDSGVREIRLWMDLALVYPSPIMYRVVARDSAVQGEVFFFGTMKNPEDDDTTIVRLVRKQNENLRRVLESRCDRMYALQSMLACRAKFTTPPDWNVVLAQLEAHHVRTLPTMKTLQSRSSTNYEVLDGWGMIVEVRDGTAYRRYAYDNPESYRHVWPEEISNALGIVDAFRSVDSRIAQESEQ